MIIVDIIGSIDDKIENNEKIIEKTLSYCDLFHKLYKLNHESNVINILDIGDIKYGKGIPTKNIFDTGLYEVYGSNGIIGYLNDYEFEEKKIAISCRGNSSGNIHLTNKKSTITSNSLFINFKDFKLTYYIFLEYNKKGLYEFKTGSAQPQITIENLSVLNVNIPILLNDYFEIVIPLIDNIEKIKNENKKLNELKQLYLKKFFG